MDEIFDIHVLVVLVRDKTNILQINDNNNISEDTYVVLALTARHSREVVCLDVVHIDGTCYSVCLVQVSAINIDILIIHDPFHITLEIYYVNLQQLINSLKLKLKLNLKNVC